LAPGDGPATGTQAQPSTVPDNKVIPPRLAMAREALAIRFINT